jgi:cobyrinic acid a,c-diamide synthase
MISAPNSGSGKTTITLALLRALNRGGYTTQSFKAGPDYIDPKFHQAASHMPCYNLDPWAMGEGLIHNLISQSGGRPFIVEAMMGLFDGAAAGVGSPAQLAKLLNLPVILVLDCAKTSHSIAAVAHGFMSYDKNINIAGLILNRVGSLRHESMQRDALASLEIPILGAIHRNEALELPDRHLGLVPAGEHPALDGFLDNAADVIGQSLDISAIKQMLQPNDSHNAHPLKTLPPLGQKIAIAQDEAFCFSYPHFMKAWQNAGAEISFFSPLNDEPPDANCDAIYLPGGYPELHCETLSNAENFKSAMRQHGSAGVLIYGECGGYMTLGKSIIDAKGMSHEMLNLLPLITSFESRKLHLGYRKLEIMGDNSWISQLPRKLMAHEFHYATIVEEKCDKILFKARDSQDNDLGTKGMVLDNVMGSFMHLIDGDTSD